MTPEELTVILVDFRERAHQNKVVLKMLRDWDKNIHLTATDVDVPAEGAPGGEGPAHPVWTLVLRGGRVQSIEPTAVEPRDIHIQAGIEGLAGIFRGELNPAKEFAKGNLKFTGSSKDEMRLDAIIQYLWD